MLVRRTPGMRHPRSCLRFLFFLLLLLLNIHELGGRAPCHRRSHRLRQLCQCIAHLLEGPALQLDLLREGRYRRPQSVQVAAAFNRRKRLPIFDRGQQVRS